MAEETSVEQGGNRLSNYLNSTREELRKVVWPSRDEAVNLTIVVLFVTALMTVLLGGIDFLFTQLLDLVVGLV
ncbi:MAG: preprotein translocase subunit SecE [Caldilineae bacterium]|nr:preprotein translocase subunit SecE [Chloroflexota bacterium]MCB9177682.1 preprotein translocase subunit SecE [Caldilineae bacterium]